MRRLPLLEVRFLGTVVSYQRGMEHMCRAVEQTREALREGKAPDAQLLLLEHRPVVTVTRPRAALPPEVSDDLKRNRKPPDVAGKGTQCSLRLDRRALARLGVELVQTDRGGDVTYHGPGQLVGYPIVPLPRGANFIGVGRYLRRLEQALLDACGELGVSRCTLLPGKTGVWLTPCHSRGRGLPKSRDAMNRVSTNKKHPKMDSRLRGNDKVGRPASGLSENAVSTERHTLSLSFPRRRESIEKASNSRLTDFLEIPGSGNPDRLDEVKEANRLNKFGGRASKLVAIGIGVTHDGITRHGFAVNVCADLALMQRCIVPCGLIGMGVANLDDTLRQQGVAVPSVPRLCQVIARHVAAGLGMRARIEPPFCPRLSPRSD